VDSGRLGRRGMNPILAQFVPAVKGIAKMFGDRCEVILHDISDLEHSVVMIENSHVTGRKIGAPVTDLGLYFLQSDIFKDTDYVANYQTESKGGKKLKSTSIFIRDKNRKIVGFLCINFAIDELLKLNQEVADFCVAHKDIDQIKTVEESDESFTNTLDALFAKVFAKAVREIGKPVEKMQKEDKVEMVSYLYKRGAFLVNGTLAEVASRLNVSRYTIYNYLAEVKKKRSGKTTTILKDRKEKRGTR
jgi:predicted transcriptional regulator YheO